MRLSALAMCDCLSHPEDLSGEVARSCPEAIRPRGVACERRRRGRPAAPRRHGASKELVRACVCNQPESPAVGGLVPRDGRSAPREPQGHVRATREGLVAVVPRIALRILTQDSVGLESLKQRVIRFHDGCERVGIPAAPAHRGRRYRATPVEDHSLAQHGARPSSLEGEQYCRYAGGLRAAIALEVKEDTVIMISFPI